jgi:hypothetical protein
MGEDVKSTRKKGRWRIWDTKVANMAYITFIDGIVLMPVAVRRNVREVWMFMVIYKQMKEICEWIAGTQIETSEVKGLSITKASMFSLSKNEVFKTYPTAPIARTCKYKILTVKRNLEIEGNV